MMRPTCGHCGYDLTGAESNRCPECGWLFIEAGVRVGPDGDTRRKRFRRAVILAIVLLAGAGVMLTAEAYLRARAARDQAIAQRQAALAQQRAATQRQAGATPQAEDDSHLDERGERSNLVTDPADAGDAP
ncbi:MAG: hypothetical protein KDA33_02735 [Phycisphaerales bacterium]|nr:hypothetical protein [Phycisphaerales bacterium]